MLVVLIILFALIIRLHDLSGNPPALNWDEVSHGYNAYSILKTGKDEWGVSFPVVFRAYGDYKLPVYIYTAVLSVWAFGLNEFAIRLPSVLAGVGTVLFTFLLAKKLFDKNVALLSTLLVAVEPWSFFLSRPALEANLSVFFVTSGVYFFLLGLKKYSVFQLSIFLLGLSIWTYNSARVFVPLLILALILIYRKDLLRFLNKSRKIFVFTVICGLVFFLPMFWQLFTSVGQARYEWVAILDEGAINEINNLRNQTTLNPLVSSIVYNKGVYFTFKFAQNWLSHFSPEFLFFKGGSNFQFNLPNQGLLYLVNIPFFAIGILLSIKEIIYNKKDLRKPAALILIWLLLAPIASSLTREAPHTLRAITFLPTPMILSALGVITALKVFKNKIFQGAFFAVYLLLLSIFCVKYMNDYFRAYPQEYSWSWQYGYQEAVDFAKSNYFDYDTIIFTKKYGEPHEFLLFYWPWKPGNYMEDPDLLRFYQSNWYWVDRFDKFYFVNDWEIPGMEDESWKMESGGEVPTGGRNLLITSPGNYPPGWQKIKVINFLDGNPVFDILKSDD